LKQPAAAKGHARCGLVGVVRRAHRGRPVNESDNAGLPPIDPAPAAAPAGGDVAAADPAPSSSGPSSAGPSSAGDGEAATGADGEAAGEGERRRRRRRRRRRGERPGGDASGAPAGDGTAPVGGDAASDPATAGEPAAPRPPRHDRAANGGKGQGRQERQERHGRQERHDRHDRHGRRDPRGQGQGHGHGRTRGDSQHAALQAVQALAEMAHTLLHIEGVDPLAMPRYLELNLRIPLDGGNDVRHAAGTAVEQISKRVREVREHEKALRPGAVYSYFADSSHADGCRPAEPRQVFEGYSSTGKPQFADFVTMAIERKDPNIDRLLAGEDIVLTRVTMGRVLRTQQLAEFGGNSPVFKILGQVDAGLFRTLDATGRCAFSFQLLRGTTLEGRARLRLHTVGAVDPMDLADPGLMQILSRFQRQLDAEAMRLQGQQQGGEVDEEAFVLPLLQDLARQLQGRTRNAGRRTQHGLERSEEGQRPTSRAYPDAAEASDDAILWDLDQSTVVVLGGKGRVHVFTPQGKHVTSVMMQGHAIERRLHTGRWRNAEPEERGEFRLHIKRLVASGEDKPTEDGPLPSGGAD
jgi:hypothetical protein